MDEESRDGSTGDMSLLPLYSMDMNFLPLYPEEKDIIALEESVKVASHNQISWRLIKSINPSSIQGLCEQSAGYIIILGESVKVTKHNQYLEDW